MEGAPKSAQEVFESNFNEESREKIDREIFNDSDASIESIHQLKPQDAGTVVELIRAFLNSTEPSQKAEFKQNVLNFIDRKMDEALGDM